MNSINTLFRKRIGYPLTKELNFGDLDDVLERTARTIPFENLCIMKKKEENITEEFLVEKLLHREEGGLCFEINPILYRFLKENGFHVTLVSATVFDQSKKKWSETGRTHVAIVLYANEERFLVDSGFGGNLPLKPVPLSGRAVASDNGEFRLIEKNLPVGNYLFEMKRRDKDQDWTIGYAFDSNNVIKQMEELEDMRKIIVESDASAFNKRPLVSRLTERGSIILTDSSLTIWDNGKMTKEDIDEASFRRLVKEKFGIKYQGS